MSEQTLLMDSAPAIPDETPAWAAVFSMTLGVFGLVTAEFLPASLLTPMAADLRVTEGAAGQAVTAWARAMPQYAAPRPATMLAETLRTA